MFGIMKYLRISLIFSFLTLEVLAVPQFYPQAYASSLGRAPVGFISRVGFNGDREVLSSLGNAPVAVYRKQEFPVRVVPYFVPRDVYQVRPKPRPNPYSKPNPKPYSKPYPKPYPKGQNNAVSGRNNAASVGVKNNNSLLGLDLGGLLGGLLGGGGGGGLLGR